MEAIHGRWRRAALLALVMALGLMAGCATPEQADGDGDVDGDVDSDADAVEDAGDADTVDSGADADSSGDADADSSADGAADADRIPACGDGIVDSGEACDDGNADNSDGCDDGCALTGVDEVFLQVRNVPLLADRLFLALDGGGLPEPAALVVDTAGGDVVHLRFPAGAGGPYRLRVLATIGTGFPSALSGGRVAGVTVPADGAAGAVVELSPTAVVVDPSTPGGAIVGQPFSMSLTVTDPAQALEGATMGRVWSAADPFDDVSATQDTGELSRAGGDDWSFTATVTAGNPNVARTMYYQFGEAASDFAHGGEVPFVVRPSVRAGEDLLQMSVTISNAGMDITVTDVPVLADRVYISIDGGPVAFEPLRWDEATVGGEAHFSLGLPPADDYRVRAVATVGGGSFPIVLAGGRVEAIDVPVAPVVDVAVPLTSPAYAFGAAPPSTVTVGDTYDVELTITVPADFLEGAAGGRVWWGTAPMDDVTGSQESGTLTRLGPGSYYFSAAMPPPAAVGTVYLQFGEASGHDEFGRSGTIAPFLALPTAAAGEALRTVDVIAATEGIEVTASPVPAGAGLVVVMIDGPGATRRYELTPVGGTAAGRLGVPAGGPYRVRVVAITAPPGDPAVRAGGHVAAVTVAAGAFTPAGVTLTAPTLTIDPATPAAAAPSSAATITLRVADPARFLDGRTSGRLWSDTAPFENLVGDQRSGTLVEESPGVFRFDVDITTPAALGTLYYQFGEAGGGGGSWGTPRWAPFLVLPDTTLGESLLELTIE